MEGKLANLRTPTLIEGVRALARPGPLRTRAQAIPELVPLLPHLESALDALSSAYGHKPEPKVEQQRRTVSALLGEKIDRYQRLVQRIESKFEELQTAGEAARAQARMRALIVPEKLSTRPLPTEIAGRARQLEARLDAEVRESLKATPGPERDMLQAAEELVSLGRSLGELQARRADLEAHTGERAELDARRRLVKLVEVAVALLEATGQSEETVRALFGAVLAGGEAPKRRRSEAGK
jgi:hypothetical protein